MQDIKVKYDPILGFRYIEFPAIFPDSKMDFDEVVEPKYIEKNKVMDVEYNRKSFSRNGNSRNVVLNKAVYSLAKNNKNGNPRFSKNKEKHYKNLVSKLE